MTSIRKKLAAKALVENRGKSVSAAMRKAGYSEAYSTNPQQFTKTKEWQELMEKYLPDVLLAKKHKELLTVPVKTTIKRKGLADIKIEELDTFAVSKGLDMAYKLKKRYDNTIKLTGKLDGISDDELEERIAGTISGVISALSRKGKKKE